MHPPKTLWVFIGLLAYFVVIRLVGKYQTRAVMRRARITIFSASLGILLLISLLKMGTDWHKIEAYKRRGVVTQADVTGKFTELDLPRFGGTRYKVDYAYSDSGGDKYASEDDVPYPVWKPLFVGGRVEIEYLSDKPSDSALNFWGRYYESVHVCMALSLLSGAALLWAIGKPPGTGRRNLEAE